MVFSAHERLSVVLIALLALPLNAVAEPFAAPGDMLLRHDLQLLNDSGAIELPMTAWPIALGDIARALRDADRASLGVNELATLRRLDSYLDFELETGSWLPGIHLAAAENPRVIRTFEATPRENGEAGASLSWLGERFAVNLAATWANDPFDGDEVRPDGTYVGAAFGNWSVTAGWQDRWWGPGRDGSLILSSNARPTPGIALQRIASTPFENRWLGWVGPWTFTTFLTELDDERGVRNALLFGVRGSFRPPRTGLEIGISRTAQWCGDGRPCDGSAFVDLLLGNDNRGVNVDPADEPGNQLGGIDLRWTLPRDVPVALYLQWIGEDGRGGGGAIGSWLRQLGVEYWGQIGGLQHRTHFEVSDTMCREGGAGFSDRKPNCAYGHSIYRTGYRYKGRSMGHAADGDSLSYSLGSTLVQSGGSTWNTSLRYMEINRDGPPNARHTLTPTPQDVVDFQVSHNRATIVGWFDVGVGYSRLKDIASGASQSDVTAFVQWSSH